jgi:hypothetical protein
MRRVIVVLAVVTAPAALLATQAADASARSAADGLTPAAPHLARAEPAAPPPSPPLLLTDGPRSAGGVPPSRPHDAAVPPESRDLSGCRMGSAMGVAETAGVCAGTGRPNARAPPQSG